MACGGTCTWGREVRRLCGASQRHWSHQHNMEVPHSNLLCYNMATNLTFLNPRLPRTWTASPVKVNIKLLNGKEHKDQDEYYYNSQAYYPNFHYSFAPQLSNIQVVEALNGRVKMFTGDDNELFTEWLKDYVNVLTVFQIHKSQGKAILPLYLSGTAKTKYDLLTTEEKYSWESLTLALAKKLKNDDTIRNIKAELLSFKMGDLKLSEYTKKIRKMVNVVYQGQGREVIEKESIYHLVVCLNDDIRWKIERLPTPSSFEEAYNIISKHLRISKEKRDREKELESVNQLSLLNKRLEQLKLKNEPNGDEYPEFDDENYDKYDPYNQTGDEYPEFDGYPNCDEYDPSDYGNYCEADEENYYPYDEAHDEFNYECDPEENYQSIDQFNAGNGDEYDPNVENSWQNQENGHDDENYQYERENYGSDGQRFHGNYQNYNENNEWINDEFDPEYQENYYHHDQENYQNENDEEWDYQNAHPENFQQW